MSEYVLNAYQKLFKEFDFGIHIPHFAEWPIYMYFSARKELALLRECASKKLKTSNLNIQRTVLSIK